jgi:hypothetical protein
VKTQAERRREARSHQIGGYHFSATVQRLGQTSPGGYHLHYVNEANDDETVIWLDPADAPVTGVCIGTGSGDHNDVAAIFDALQSLEEIARVLRTELAARIGVHSAAATEGKK